MAGPGCGPLAEWTALSEGATAVWPANFGQFRNRGQRRLQTAISSDTCPRVRFVPGRRRGGGGRFDLGETAWAALLGHLQSGDSLRGESVVTGALHHRSGPQSAAVATCLLDGGY
uniref:Ketoacyl_synth_N domain-containing protein n=1 Tax=Macrostomum lignano TaxID=282301 RepID=A0A1I8FBI7_9PLAT